MLAAGTEYTMEVKAKVLPAVDIVVAGGGTAGCTAALAAARNGANVLLIERQGFLGGMITAGNGGLTMFTKFSGNAEEHANDQKTLATTPEQIQIAGGLTMEIAERLLAEGIGIGNSGTAGSYIFTSSEDFKRLLLQMMKEEQVNLRLHSWVTDVIQEDGKIQGVVVESKSGREIIPAKHVIDTTGDGDVAARAGVPYFLGVTPDDVCAAKAKIGEMHPMGVMFKAGNVDLAKTFAWLKANPEHFGKQPFARFTLEEAAERFEKNEMGTINIISDNAPPSRFQVYNLPTAGVVTLCCPCVKGDGTNADDLTRAEIVMADMVARWLDNMRGIPGFENAFLLDCPQIGVRETRHIQGDYVLNIEDVYHSRDFDDCIGFGSHPIDTTPRPDWLKDPATAYPPRWFFKIPFRSLIAKDKDNLLVAGRCLSATHEAFGCIRPTVQCMITGEAAGTAAALCIKHDYGNIRQLPIEELRQTLLAQGGKL